MFGVKLSLNLNKIFVNNRSHILLAQRMDCLAERLTIQRLHLMVRAQDLSSASTSKSSPHSYILLSLEHKLATLLTSSRHRWHTDWSTLFAFSLLSFFKKTSEDESSDELKDPATDINYVADEDKSPWLGAVSTGKHSTGFVSDLPVSDAIANTQSVPHRNTVVQTAHLDAQLETHPEVVQPKTDTVEIESVEDGTVNELLMKSDGTDEEHESEQLRTSVSQGSKLEEEDDEKNKDYHGVPTLLIQHMDESDTNNESPEKIENNNILEKAEHFFDSMLGLYESLSIQCSATERHYAGLQDELASVLETRAQCPGADNPQLTQHELQTRAQLGRVTDTRRVQNLDSDWVLQELELQLQKSGKLAFRLDCESCRSRALERLAEVKDGLESARAASRAADKRRARAEADLVLAGSETQSD